MNKYYFKKSYVNINKDFPWLLGRKERETDLKINFAPVYYAGRNEIHFNVENTFCEEISYILLTTPT